MSKIIDVDEKKEILVSLESLGLSPKESAVYLSLLELGETGATAISLETRLHRQFVYDTLSSLEEKGLIGHSVVRGRKKFFSHPVSRLSVMFDRKKKVADELVSSIEKKLLPVDIQQFEVYRGQESFVLNELDTIARARPGSQVLILGGIGDDYIKTMGRSFQEYDFQRQKKGIEVLYLGGTEQKKYLSESRDTRKLFSYRILPAVFTGVMNFAIYEDFVSFNLFASPVSSFVVRSEKIAQSYRDFFMGLWNLSK